MLVHNQGHICDGVVTVKCRCIFREWEVLLETRLSRKVVELLVGGASEDP